MSLLEPVFFNLALILFCAGVLFMHLRLRSKTSLTMLFSFIPFATIFKLQNWFFSLYIDFTTPPASEQTTMTPELQIQQTAEAFENSSGLHNFETILFVVFLVSFLVFSASFFLSARSIPCLTTQSR